MQKYRRILVPVDGSKLSDMATDLAMRFARMNDGNITIIHVADEAPISLYGLEGKDVLSVVRKLTVERKNRVDSLTDRYISRGKKGGFKIRKLFKKGDPADEIIKSSSHFDIIIMGTRGRSTVQAFFLGSVAEKVSKRSCCPVLLVRERREDCGKT